MLNTHILISPEHILKCRSMVTNYINSLVDTCSKKYGIVCSIDHISDKYDMKISTDSPNLTVSVDFNAQILRPKLNMNIEAVVIGKVYDGYLLYALKDGKQYDKFAIFVRVEEAAIGDVMRVMIKNYVFTGNMYKCFAYKND